MRPVTVDEALAAIGTGRFQHRLLAIFGLVWAADAMQVLAIGFAAPSLAASFGLSIPQAIQAGTAFFLACCWAPGASAGSPTGSAGAGC
jgi:MFS transporter, putative metabolite:H+ symporter